MVQIVKNKIKSYLKYSYGNQLCFEILIKQQVGTQIC